MKRITLLFALFACLAVLTASAQNVSIRVYSGGEPLEYAYLFVNGIYHTSADSTGTGFIPASRLEPGDTISAGYVGMEDGYAVYSGNPGRLVEVELRSNNLIGSVVVYAKDQSRALFRRYVRKSPIGHWDTEYRGAYSLTFPDGHSARGDYSVIFTPPGIVDYFGIDEVTLQPVSDTLGRSRTIENILDRTTRCAHGAAAVKRHYGVARGMIVKYRGKEGGRHVFLIVRPFFDGLTGIPESFQTLLYADETSRLIVSTQTLYRTQNQTLRLKADYLPIHFRNEEDRLYPVRMEGSWEESDPERKIVSTRFFMDRTTVHEYPRPSIPRRDRSKVGNIYIRK
jgi:hypothetical protein